MHVHPSSTYTRHCPESGEKQTAVLVGSGLATAVHLKGDVTVLSFMSDPHTVVVFHRVQRVKVPSAQLHARYSRNARQPYLNAILRVRNMAQLIIQILIQAYESSV